jgi:hypothetical protein
MTAKGGRPHVLSDHRSQRALAMGLPQQFSVGTAVQSGRGVGKFHRPAPAKDARVLWPCERGDCVLDSCLDRLTSGQARRRAS